MDIRHGLFSFVNISIAVIAAYLLFRKKTTRNLSVARAFIHRLLSAVLRGRSREFAVGDAGIVRASAWPLGMDELRPTSKDERYSGGRNMVACALE